MASFIFVRAINALQKLVRVCADGTRKSEELKNIEPTLAAFILADCGLRFTEPSCDLLLCKPRMLAGFAQLTEKELVLL